MDHHCYFVGNCIGLQNYKVYFLLLFFGIVNLLQNSFLYIYLFLYNSLGKFKSKFSAVSLPIFIFIFIIQIIISGLLFPLFYQHLKYVLKNDGTLFNLINQQDNTSSRNSFNFGKLFNLKQLFHNIFYLVVPLKCEYKFEG